MYLVGLHIILSVFCVDNSWSFFLRKQYSLKAFKDKILKTVRELRPVHKCITMDRMDGEDYISWTFMI